MPTHDLRPWIELTQFAVGTIGLALAMVAISSDRRLAPYRRFVVALVFAVLLAGGGIFAAEIPFPDLCSRCPDMPWALQVFYGCFIWC